MLTNGHHIGLQCESRASYRVVVASFNSVSFFNSASKLKPSPMNAEALNPIGHLVDDFADRFFRERFCFWSSFHHAKVDCFHQVSQSELRIQASRASSTLRRKPSVLFAWLYLAASTSDSLTASLQKLCAKRHEVVQSGFISVVFKFVQPLKQQQRLIPARCSCP